MAIYLSKKPILPTPSAFSQCLTKREQKGSFTGRSRRGGVKQPHQKYVITNDHKNEFDKVY